MALTDLLKPRWKHPDPQKRLAAIQKIGDQYTLRQIVETDSNAEVREAALQKITDQSSLRFCVERGFDAEIRLAALEKITDKDIISTIARKVLQVDPNIQIASIEKISDPNLLSWIVRNEKNSTVRDAAEKRQKHLVDAENAMLKACEKIAVLDMNVPMIEDKAAFSRIVQRRNIPLGLLLNLDDFESVYGDLLMSIPNPLEARWNPFYVSAENGPSRLFCPGCKKLFSGSTVFGLTAAKEFKGGVTLGGNVKQGLAHACPNCGSDRGVIVYQPKESE